MGVLFIEVVGSIVSGILRVVLQKQTWTARARSRVMSNRKYMRDFLAPPIT